MSSRRSPTQSDNFGEIEEELGVLGLDSMTDSELGAMMQDGDLDGDETLSEHELCVLMIRLSPSLMDEAYKWLHNTLLNDLEEILNRNSNTVLCCDWSLTFLRSGE